MEASGQLLTGCLNPREEPSTPMQRKAEWAPEPVRSLWGKEKVCPCWESNAGPSNFGSSYYVYSWSFV